jgi:hypothetical protein
MAGRHACLTWSDDGLSIRDLDSPGGTFVNRQRLLAGQSRLLQPGDLIQLGGVQLEVKRESLLDAETTRPAQPQPGCQPQPSLRPVSQGNANSEPAALSVPFVIPGGSTCKTWDDFLILAAQRWTLFRDELTSGRVAEHLKRIGRADLSPRPEHTQTADEQLDAWLARLPTSRPSDPELDVHPQSLVIRAAATGGLISKTLRISNVGFRLLRSSVRVEPATSKSIQIAVDFSARTFATIDHTDIPVAIELPENPVSKLLGTVVVESNGGTRRIEILIERPALVGGDSEGASGVRTVQPLPDSRQLIEFVSAQPTARRLLLAPLALVAFRLIVLVAGMIPLGLPGASRFEPRLASMALLLAAVGALAGGVSAKEPRDRLACGFTGAMLGVLGAAVGFALVRSVEALLGSWASSPPAALLLWASLGLAIALVSCVALPPSRVSSTSPQEPAR